MKCPKCWMILTAVIIRMSLLLLSSNVVDAEMIPLGAIFDRDSKEIEGAFLHALNQYNQNTSSKHLQLHAFVDIISTADAFKISRLCEYTNITLFPKLAFCLYDIL
ncbi:AMPA glutamate receptor activity protein [Halocaridina rubra]|uniref:AMPA glutamate receptor activity protein n=1 Tax=Halocaridina rubra TaxID=373956 RepID=A0AAN8ZVM4_HALRR